MDRLKYEELVEKCKSQISDMQTYAKRGAEKSWALADLLASVEIVNKGQTKNDDGVGINDLSRDVGLSVTYILNLRRASKRFPKGQRVDSLPPYVHLAAQSHYGTTDATVAELDKNKDSVRIKDFVHQDKPRTPKPKGERQLLATVRRITSMTDRVTEKLPEDLDEELRGALGDLENSFETLFKKVRVEA
jgi:hypothetical protein